MATALLILSWRQYNYALLMKRRRTDVIALSAVVRLIYLVLVLWGGFLVWPDPRFVAVAYTVGFLIEAFITHFGARKIGAL
jgi:hypothetical protein